MGTIKEQTIENLLKKVSPKLWGESYPEFEPVLLKKVLGDGNQLIWFQTNDCRPYWWWVLIDSNTNVSSSEFEPHEIWDMIEDEFGSFDYDEEENQTKDAYDLYPMIDSNGGCLWGSQEIFN